MIEIQFSKPKIYSPNPMKFVFTFPFVIIIHKTDQYNDIYNREFPVSIDGMTKNTLKHSNDELEKIVFKFLLDSKKITLENLQSLSKGKIGELIIPTQTKRIYNPNKLDDPNGYTIKFDNIKTKNKMGF